MDEKPLTVPGAWLRRMHPRRGGVRGPVPWTSPQASAKTRALVVGGEGDSEVAREARRYLDGAAGTAASAITAVVSAAPKDAVAVQRAFVDAWTVEHGVGFATCALVEVTVTKVTRDAGGNVTGVGRRKGGDGLGGVEPETVRRIRGPLAVADDDAHADAVGRLAGVRAETPLKRWLVSYRVPTQRHWVSECIGARIELKPYLRWLHSDLALTHLHAITRKDRFAGLRERAREKTAEVARYRGLTAAGLADRLVPGSGTLVLDYGPRRFTIRLDERLAPVVTGETGRVLRTLPGPGARDDRAPAAYRTFAALRKDVRAVAPRAGGPAGAGHARLAAVVPGGVPRLSRRPPAGRALRAPPRHDGVPRRRERPPAGAADAPFVLPGAIRVGIAHPLGLGGSLGAWSQVFADYEITQPFPQLGRLVHAMTEDERGSARLERFEGAQVPSGAVLGLVRRGWERGAPQDAGTAMWMFRRISAHRHVAIASTRGSWQGRPVRPADARPWTASDRLASPARTTPAPPAFRRPGPGRRVRNPLRPGRPHRRLPPTHEGHEHGLPGRERPDDPRHVAPGDAPAPRRHFRAGRETGA